MTDEQHNTPQPVERVSLTELYHALPDRLADSEEAFDVEAGLADLHSWIDAQPETESAGSQTFEVVLTTRDARDLQAAQSLSPDFADRWLSLEERRVALEEAHAEAQAFALRHRLDEATRESAHRRELEAADAAHRRALELRALELEEDSAREARLKRLGEAEEEREVELRRLALLEEENRSRLRARAASRQLTGRVLAVAMPSIAWSIGFLISVVNGLSALTLVFSFGLIGLGTIYGLAIFVAVSTATTAHEPGRRRDAERVMRFLLFREGHSAEDPSSIGRPDENVRRSRALAERRRRSKL